MSFMHAAPEALKAAASNIAGIGTEISSANAAAALPTTGVVAAAADQVSAQIAAVFSTHAEGYQQLSAQISAFHEKFVQTMDAGANAYANAESSAARSLASAVNAPAATFEQSFAASGSTVGKIAAEAAGRVESFFQTTGGLGALGSRFAAATNAAASPAISALQTLPTGAARALTAASALLQPMNVTGVAAALPAASTFGDGIKAIYLAVEPYVAYGFDLASYAAGWIPWIGWIVAPQIQFFYNWIEPMVQSGLFNILDWLGGSITFSQGLNNFLNVAWNETWQFFYDEFYWIFGSILPPLPPLPPFFP